MPLRIRGVDVSDADLVQRFANNFIEVSVNKGKPEVLMPVTFEGGKMYYDGGNKAHPLKSVEITREFPELGAIEHEGYVHFLSRLPKRQWTRGLNRSVISDYCRGQALKFSAKMDMARANAVFYPQYTPMDVGFDKIKKEEIQAFARNAKFWFSGNKNKVYLWFEDVAVGEIVAGNRLFANPQCRTLLQEVKDEFKDAVQVV